MPQSIWKGAISFGLVTIPVKLYSATEEKDISFHQVHRDDGGRIRYKRVCSVDGEEVPYGDIAKGYELPDGEMVVLNDEDFADLPLDHARDRRAAVRAGRAGRPDPFAKAYYCDPTGDAKPYVLLRDALESPTRSRSSRWRCASASRSPCCASATACSCCRRCCGRTRCASRELGFLDEDINVRPQELAMAESFIDALSGDFDPSEYNDQYREALQEVIEAKVAGREVVEAGRGAGASGRRRPDGGAAAQRARPRNGAARPASSPGSAAEAAADRQEAPAKKAAAKSPGEEGSQEDHEEEGGYDEEGGRPRRPPPVAPPRPSATTAALREQPEGRTPFPTTATSGTCARCSSTAP